MTNGTETLLQKQTILRVIQDISPLLSLTPAMHLHPLVTILKGAWADQVNVVSLSQGMTYVFNKH